MLCAEALPLAGNSVHRLKTCSRGSSCSVASARFGSRAA